MTSQMLLDPEKGTLRRVGYVYCIKHNGAVPLVSVVFTVASKINVLADDPGLPALELNCRVLFSEPLPMPEGMSRAQTVRQILQIERWEPVWTLINPERRRSWNQNSR